MTLKLKSAEVREVREALILKARIHRARLRWSRAETCERIVRRIDRQGSQNPHPHTSLAARRNDDAAHHVRVAKAKSKRVLGAPKASNLHKIHTNSLKP